jgi:hypothetical protein
MLILFCGKFFKWWVCTIRITCLEWIFFTFMSEIWHVIMSYLCRGNKFDAWTYYNALCGNAMPSKKMNFVHVRTIMLEFMFYWIGKRLCDNRMCQLSLKRMTCRICNFSTCYVCVKPNHKQKERKKAVVVCLFSTPQLTKKL